MTKPANPEEITLFRWADQLPEALWDDLAARPLVEAAQACGAELEGRSLRLPLLGGAYLVDVAARRVLEAGQPDRRLGFQTGLVLVSHLARALGVPPAGRLVTPQELPGGSLFFTGPHAVATAALERRFGHDPQGLLAAAQALGGQPYPGAAEVAAMVPGLPMLPLYVLLWPADEEFGARAVVALDAHAHHQLALDGLWALTNLLVGGLLAVARPANGEED
ncbi:MAG: DUF3786 domain-containing protein [Desulfarculus sp.]|nr:DUF3786 domain-containing protein [Desulfarculus sp.]